MESLIKFIRLLCKNMKESVDQPKKPRLPKAVYLKISKIESDGHKCPACNLVFTTAGDLKLHSFTENRTISCSMCSTKFLTVKGMKQHFGKWHTAYKPFRCNLCDRKFRNIYASRIHRRQVHMHSARQQCTFCSKVLFNKYSMKRHLTICSPLEANI